MVKQTKKAAEKEEQVKTPQQEAGQTQQPAQQATGKAAEKEEQVSGAILALMKLYSQYEEFYVTPKGFVHPKNAPAYLRQGAKLYKNKFYNK